MKKTNTHCRTSYKKIRNWVTGLRYSLSNKMGSCIHYFIARLVTSFSQYGELLSFLFAISDHTYCPWTFPFSNATPSGGIRRGVGTVSNSAPWTMMKAETASEYSWLKKFFFNIRWRWVIRANKTVKAP